MNVFEQILSFQSGSKATLIATKLAPAQRRQTTLLSGGTCSWIFRMHFGEYPDSTISYCRVLAQIDAAISGIQGLESAVATVAFLFLQLGRTECYQLKNYAILHNLGEGLAGGIGKCEIVAIILGGVVIPYGNELWRCWKARKEPHYNSGFYDGYDPEQRKRISGPQ